MTGKTNVGVAVGLSSLLFPITSILMLIEGLCIAILGALLPDIDIEGSLVSGWVYKVLQGLLGVFLVAFILVDDFVSRLQG